MNDFMDTPTIAVETAAVSLELLFPATATEQLGGRAIVGGLKFAGKPAANIVNKGKKKILEGWGNLLIISNLNTLRNFTQGQLRYPISLTTNYGR